MPIGVVMKPSEKDRKELDRFVKNFVSKCVQVILQSRYDEPERTPCKTKGSPSDWFHLNIPDVAEFSDQLKTALNPLPQKTLSLGTSLCIDLSLYTKDKEKFVLETWELSLMSETDASAKSTYEVYCRMAILLKSLIGVSRVVPAYRLALSQNDEFYRLHYQIYIGPGNDDVCGENSKLLNIGNVGMLHGTVNLSVRYRTKLLMTSKEKLKKDNNFMVTSDYFSKTESEGNKGCPRDIHGNEFTLDYPISTQKNRQNKALNASSPYGAFASHVPPKPETVPEDLCDMFCTLLLDPDETIPVEAATDSADEEKDEDKYDLWDDTKSVEEESKNPSEHFVYVDLKPAFAEHSSDIGMFFMHAPPTLKSLQETGANGTNEEHQNGNSSETLVKQVEQMNAEIKFQELDQFITEVCGAES